MIDKYIKSPINYIGNKYKLIESIVICLPNYINTFVDLFGGSGTVLLNVTANNYIYNDINNYVADIFEGIVTSEDATTIISQIESIISKYELSKTNKAGFERLRNDYNSGMNDWITLYTLMCFSFNYQFRFNSNHEYNSSFGKDRSCFSDRQRDNIKAVKDKITSNIKCCKKSFTDFDYSILTEDDFVYCDPPYFNSVGNYNDGKRGFEGWTEYHEQELRNILNKLSTRNIKWMLSNNVACNDSLLLWARDNNYDIHYINNSYANSNYHKRDKQKEDIEVLITNY